MSFDVNAWLDEMIGPPESPVPRHQRICFLILANGGPEVHRYGVISHFGGHQHGLEQEEAIELISVNSFMGGLAAAGVDIASAINPYSPMENFSF